MRIYMVYQRQTFQKFTEILQFKKGEGLIFIKKLQQQLWQSHQVGVLTLSIAEAYMKFLFWERQPCMNFM